MIEKTPRSCLVQSRTAYDRLGELGVQALVGCRSDVVLTLRRFLSVRRRRWMLRRERWWWRRELMIGDDK
jgi:hypothetical protein